MTIPTLIVRSDFAMNPETDDLIYGEDIKEGDVVLVEDRMFRGNPAYLERLESETAYNPMRKDSMEHEIARVNENNRWCLVTDLRQRGELISFIGIYGDNTKRSRTYNQSITWFVKR